MNFYPTLGHSIVFDNLNGIKIAFSIILNMLVTVVQATELYLKVGQWFPSGMHPHFYSPETDSCFFNSYYFNIAVSQPWSWSTCNTEHVLCLPNSTHQFVGRNSLTWNGGIR